MSVFRAKQQICLNVATIRNLTSYASGRYCLRFCIYETSYNSGSLVRDDGSGYMDNNSSMGNAYRSSVNSNFGSEIRKAGNHDYSGRAVAMNKYATPVSVIQYKSNLSKPHNSPSPNISPPIPQAQPFTTYQLSQHIYTTKPFILKHNSQIPIYELCIFKHDINVFSSRYETDFHEIVLRCVCELVQIDGYGLYGGDTGEGKVVGVFDGRIKGAGINDCMIIDFYDGYACQVVGSVHSCVYQFEYLYLGGPVSYPISVYNQSSTNKQPHKHPLPGSKQPNNQYMLVNSMTFQMYCNMQTNEYVESLLQYLLKEVKKSQDKICINLEMFQKDFKSRSETGEAVKGSIGGMSRADDFSSRSGLSKDSKLSGNFRKLGKVVSPLKRVTQMHKVHSLPQRQQPQPLFHIHRLQPNQQPQPQPHMQYSPQPPIDQNTIAINIPLLQFQQQENTDDLIRTLSKSIHYQQEIDLKSASNREGLERLSLIKNKYSQEEKEVYNEEIDEDSENGEDANQNQEELIQQEELVQGHDPEWEAGRCRFGQENDLKKQRIKQRLNSAQRQLLVSGNGDQIQQQFIMQEQYYKVQNQQQNNIKKSLLKNKNINPRNKKSFSSSSSQQIQIQLQAQVEISNIQIQQEQKQKQKQRQMELQKERRRIKEMELEQEIMEEMMKTKYYTNMSNSKKTNQNKDNNLSLIKKKEQKIYLTPQFHQNTPNKITNGSYRTIFNNPIKQAKSHLNEHEDEDVIILQQDLEAFNINNRDYLSHKNQMKRNLHDGNTLANVVSNQNNKKRRKIFVHTPKNTNQNNKGYNFSLPINTNSKNYHIANQPLNLNNPLKNEAYQKQYLRIPNYNSNYNRETTNLLNHNQAKILNTDEKQTDDMQMSVQNSAIYQQRHIPTTTTQHHPNINKVNSLPTSLPKKALSIEEYEQILHRNCLSIYQKWRKFVSYLTQPEGQLLLTAYQVQYHKKLISLLNESVSRFKGSLDIDLYSKQEMHRNKMAAFIRGQVADNQRNIAMNQFRFYDKKLFSKVKPIMFQEKFEKVQKEQSLQDSNNLYNNHNKKSFLKVSLSSPQALNKNSQIKHLIILVHGLGACRVDMQKIKSQLKRGLQFFNFTKGKSKASSKLGMKNIHIVISSSNQGRTQGNIQLMGVRLAHQVQSQIMRHIDNPDNIEGSGIRVSLIGHSMGGIIIRSALPKLEKFKSLFHSYVSMSSPHVGYNYSNSKLIDVGLWMINNWKKCESILQLTMSDTPNTNGNQPKNTRYSVQDTFLYKLSLQKGMEWFKKITFLASRQDLYVPYFSARVQKHQQCLNDLKSNNFYAVTHSKMVDNILSRINGTVTRIDVNFCITQQNIDNLIGRAAHICFVNNVEFLRLLCMVDENTLL